MRAIKNVIPFARKKKDDGGTIYYRAKKGEELLKEYEGSYLIDQRTEHIHYCPHCGEHLYCKACGKEID